MNDLKHISIPINAPAEKVYAAFATQAGMRSCWTADTTMEERIGGKAEFGFEKRQMGFRMTIDRLDPAQCVVMRCHGDQPGWNNTTLSWDLVKSQSDEGRSRFVLCTAAGAS